MTSLIQFTSFSPTPPMFAWCAVVTSVWWNARPGKTGTCSSRTRPRSNTRPSRTDCSAAARVASVMWLSIPCSSCSPKGEGHQRAGAATVSVREAVSMPSESPARPARYRSGVTPTRRARQTCMDVSFDSVALVAAVAVIAPLAVTFVGVRLPAIVVEILLGIMIGPQVLGWATVDEPVTVLGRLGLAFLLLLAGLEIDFARLRGRVLRVTSLSFAVSLGLALVLGYALRAAHVVKSPLLLAIVLSATGLGIVLPILKDAGQTSTAFGQVIVAGASIAEVAPIVLLSLFFSGESRQIGSKLVLLVAFALFIAAIALAILGLERSTRISSALRSLQDTTAEIRVRGAFLLLALFVVLASKFGLEAILGAFLAGATLKLVDRDEGMTHAFFHRKLEAAGFGVFIPFFFVSTGLALDVSSLFDSPGALARVPLFLAALLVVRGVPALLYRPLAERPSQLAAGGLLQATSLSIPVVAGQIGVDLGLIRPTTYVALVAAGLLSVVIFPLIALTLLRREPRNAVAPVET